MDRELIANGNLPAGDDSRVNTAVMMAKTRSTNGSRFVFPDPAPGAASIAKPGTQPVID
jgi:hypothetical protein